MLRAVFVRTLKAGVTYERFKDAWVPEEVDGGYPAKVSVGRNVTDDRQVITVLELDMSLAEFAEKSAALTPPGRARTARRDCGDDRTGGCASTRRCSTTPVSWSARGE